MQSTHDQRTAALLEKVAELRAELWATSSAPGTGAPDPASPNEARERARAFFREAEQGYDCEHWIGPDGKLIWANGALARITGYSLEECLEMPDYPLPLIDERDRARMAARFAEAMAQQVGEDIEFRLRCKDGGLKWAAVSYHPVYDVRGVCLGHRSNVHDITRRKQAEQRQRESEHLVQRILATTPNLVYIYDFPARRTVYSNLELTGVLGYTTDQVETMGADLIGALLHPEDRAAMEAHRERVACAGDGDLLEIEFRLRHVRGGWRWLFSRDVVFARDERGQVCQMLGSAEDITSRKEAEQALQQKTEELERFFSLSPDLFCIADLDGRFRMLNPAWEATLGYPLIELIGACCLGLVHADDVPATQLALRELARGKPIVDFTNRYRSQSGQYRWIEWRSAPYGDRLVYAAARDVTERIRHQQEQVRMADQLRQSQKLESVGRLAGGIAHDFNNLLTCITGHISLAMLDLDREHPIYATLTDIGKAAERAASLTRQLLAFSRKQVIMPTVLNLNQLVEDMHHMLVRLIGEDVEFRPVMDPVLGRIRADAGQLEQILVNLVVNARDAMPQGGLLSIETANVSLSEAQARDRPGLAAGEYVMLAVADTGSGMNAEVLEHLFEPFFTTKPKEKGTGLGLATVYGAVQQAGGSIQVESREGRGSTFAIYLPRVYEAASSAPPHSEEAMAPSGKETVLLVEDEPIVMRLAERVLRRLGYTVLCAKSATDALELATSYQGELHLLMTDVVMPQMNGRMMAEEIQQLRPQIRVLFSSGYTEDVIAQHGVLERGIHFIGKPYSAEALAAKIRQVLS